MAVELSPDAFLWSVAMVSVSLVFLRWWNRNRLLPPGPLGLPLLGYYPFLEIPPQTDFLRLSKKYGPVFSFRTVGGKLFVVVNGVRVIKEVLVNRADEFTGRIKENNLVSWLSDGLGILPEDGEIWKEHRRFFLQTAKNFGFGKQEMEDRIHDEVRQMLEDIRKEGPNPIRLLLHVNYVTSSIITHILFSKKFEKDETFAQNLSDMGKIIDTFVECRHMLVGFAFKIFSNVFRSLHLSMRSLRQFTDAVVAEQIRTYNSDLPRGYVDAFLAHRDRTSGRKAGGTFTKKRLEATVVNLYSEGTDTTGSTIVDMLLELSRHPAVQMKIQEELDSVVGIERLPSWADRPKLPYLDASIQELYRTKSRFVLSSIFSNFQETTINGFLIPKRSAIFANYYSIHFDPEIFPEPEKFDPSRFLNCEGKRIKREGPYPFGLGKRSCIGEALAPMEVFIIISSIIQSFTLQPGEQEDTVRAIPRK